MKFIVELILIVSIFYFFAYCWSEYESTEIIQEWRIKKGGGWARGYSDGMRKNAPFMFAIIFSVFYYVFWYLRIIKKTKETTQEEIKREYLDYLLFFATIILFIPIIYFFYR